MDDLKFLGEGAVSKAYLMQDGNVLVIGKREDSFSNYEDLLRKTNLISGTVSAIKYPKIHQLIKPCEKYPNGAMIEDFVSGSELRDKIDIMTKEEKEQVGYQLAKFLVELHSIDFDGDKAEEMAINLGKFDRSITILSDYLDKETLEKLKVVKRDYELLMKNLDFCITHGDLNAGNIMISDDNKLSGVIDFGNMEYYIPEVEFAHMYFFDKTIYNSMVQNYEKPILDRDILLLELVIFVRHFKNIVNFEEKRDNCLSNIKNYLEQYMDMKLVECCEKN